MDSYHRFKVGFLLLSPRCHMSNGHQFSKYYIKFSPKLRLHPQLDLSMKKAHKLNTNDDPLRGFDLQLQFLFDMSRNIHFPLIYRNFQSFMYFAPPISRFPFILKLA